ncbi:MAG TPA: DUF3293 domain-containing protein [Burkholderiales bacterium]|nr:DUF3293 domain-containing protein [Burkholderiales bacterium]
MPLAPDLRAAYERAEYVVYASPGVQFRIGEPSDVIEAMMAMNRVRTAAFVSSATSRGVASPENERRLADFLLKHQLDGLQGAAHLSVKYRVYQGEGRDPQGAWKAEPSVLIMGIARAEAEALGRRLDQNAIVFIEKGGAPELVVLV